MIGGGAIGTRPLGVAAQSSGNSLLALPGVFTLTGQAASFDVTGFALPAEPGVFAIAGSAVDLTRQQALRVDHGAFVVSGQAVQFELAKGINAEAGVFTITGQPVLLSAFLDRRGLRVRAYILA